MRLDTRRSGSVCIGPVAAPPTTPVLLLRLLQAIVRPDAMEFALQKAVELGVREFQPVLCARSKSVAQTHTLERRQAHWQGILEAACAQCGRNEVPQLLEPLPLAASLAALPAAGLRWFADFSGEGGHVLGRESGVHPASPVFPHAAIRPAASLPVAFLVGPEGGLQEEEITELHAAGFRGLYLGPRILRTETAAVVGLTLLQFLCGDLDRPPA